MAWLDWSVRFVRPSWETNVTTWNMGPMGYEYSRTQLQQLLARGQAIVMVQVCVFITAGPITKLCAWGRRRVEDMCYEIRRAEACVD
jgi:hypothetical protein